MSAFLPDDPLMVAVDRVIAQLEAGAVADDVEGQLVDLKEEAGRRGKGGTIQPGEPRNEAAASQLARELACMANGDGGAILVGIADDGTPIGTELDPDWLRQRVFELTQRTLLPAVQVRTVKGVRCLVAWVGPSPERVMFNGKLVMLVADTCVDVPAGAWADRQRDVGMADWTAGPSARTIAHVGSGTLKAIRQLLRDAGLDDLAEADDPEMLRRLGALGDDGLLTRAGALLLTPMPVAPLEFMVRKVAGGDAIHQVRDTTTSLLEQLTEVELTLRAVVADMTGPDGLAVGTRPQLPVRARREALVNAIAHRDWQVPAPIFMELISHTLTVVSPGPLPGDVTPDNIISHTSVRRNPRLGEILERLKLAERQAIGVDRMFVDMLRDGHPAPQIVEDGDTVRVILNGDTVDADWTGLIGRVRPEERRNDVNSLILLDRIRAHRWVDEAGAAVATQRSAGEARTALANLEAATDHNGAPLVVARDLPRGVKLWLPGPGLGPVLDELTQADRERLLRGYVEATGQVTSTVALAITGVTRPTANADLERMVDSGVLKKKGRGPKTAYVLA